MNNGWREVTLGSVTERRTDFTPVDSESDYTIMGVQRSGWGFLEHKPIRGSQQKFAKLMRLRIDDLVYRTITAFEAPSAVAGPQEIGRFVTPQTFPVFTIDSTQLLPAYMRLLTSWPAFHGEMSARCTGTVLRRKTLAVGAFQSIPVALPPVVEQRRIVDVVGALDDTILGAQTCRNSLAQAGSDVPASLHARAASEQWPSSSLAAVLGGAGGIRTGPFGSQLHESDYLPSGPVAVVMPSNIRAHRVDFDSAARISRADADRLNQHLTQEGDILWSRRGDVTRFAVIDASSAGSLCGTGCFLLRPGDPTTSAWLEPWLASPQVGAWLEDKSVGATMKNLNRGILSEVPVAIPPMDDRLALGEAWTALRRCLGREQAILDELRGLRSNLLTALLSGEHPIPESYDALLEGVA